MDRTELAARIMGIAALDQDVRRDLYALLVERRRWVGRDEAAAELGIPRSVAAFHLDKLAGAGLLDVRFERPAGRGGPGAGRPAKLYRRADTEVSVSLPERRYDLAGALLADAVTASAAEGVPVAEALAESARRTGAELAAEVRAALPGQPSGTDARGACLDALRRLGYEPLEADGEIALANCPFHSLAERHRSLVCGMNRDLLDGFTDGLDAEPPLRARLAPAEGMCCVRIRAQGEPGAAG